MAKRRKLRVPESIDEAAERERTIGALLGQIAEAETDAEAEKEKIDAAASKRIAALRVKLFEAGRELRGFADKHWDVLTEGGKRKVVPILNAGTVRRYETSPAIVFDKDDETSIIAWLEERQLEQFLRRKVEINKEALGGDLPLSREIPGVTVSQTEKFVIKPAGRRERLECALKSGRWKVVESSSQDVGAESDLAA